MKKSTALSLVLIISFTVLHAQRKIKGSGNVVTIERQTGDYDGIEVGGFYEVELIDGTEGNITMRGEDNILENIKTEVRGGTLVIRSIKNLNLNPSRGEGVFIMRCSYRKDSCRSAVRFRKVGW